MTANTCAAGIPHADATIAGVDEAGRGPLAGAVVAAVVVLAPGQRIEGVRDSKLLSARQRERLVESIHREALAWALGRAAAHEIDTLNILNATLLAMQRAVSSLGLRPDQIVVDGNRAPEFPGFNGSVRALVGGDRSCQAVGAASILAKVARDREMLLLHGEFPQYGFDRHKGYPTAEHRAALMRLGPCAAHRRSFRPVSDAIGRSAPP